MVHALLFVLILVLVSFFVSFYLGVANYLNICLRRQFRHRRFDLCCLDHQHISAIAVTAMIFVALEY